ncbi:MAG: ABC transporter permease [Micavibrio aeruginosavorus]|uniref:ABC transporter permease n=1 Tax=Micavibrio aeruginosavorus TaxID=349221 RepID=A0A2W5A344_9BACT|nr:MAG: ABC transporter permease [Micavibrio aeruginosavorus]
MAEQPGFLTSENEGQAKRLILSGEWTLENSAEILRECQDQCFDNISEINGQSIERMDSWGVVRLQKIADETGASLQLPDNLKDTFAFFEKTEKKIPERSKKRGLYSALVSIGKNTASALKTTADIISFIGEIAVCFARNIFKPSAFRFHSIVRHIDETGFRALPIIGLLAILISMVISYQASMQLQKFGANIFTIDLTVISLLREMGVLVTAIMVAGRSGSAFAAEIGVMKLREEIDALKTMGMNPIEVLVLPRLIAMMLTLPILAFLADIIGLAGGAIISITLLDIPLDQYIDRVESVATSTMFFVGLIKAPVFAFIITIIGAYQGMNVSGSAESVGKLTTMAVVQSIFMVIMADAVFSIVFAKMGI